MNQIHLWSIGDIVAQYILKDLRVIAGKLTINGYPNEVIWRGISNIHGYSDIILFDTWGKMLPPAPCPDFNTL